MTFLFTGMLHAKKGGVDFVLGGTQTSCLNQHKALNFPECLFSLKIKKKEKGKKKVCRCYFVSSTESCFFF